jgi:precorrin-6B methylase 2
VGLFDARTAPFAFHGARLRFRLAKTLFSSAGVDAGSALLLRHLQQIGSPPGGRVLDVGCGHGVLGIVLAALDPDRSVTFLDRDALACHYTKVNLVANGLDGGGHVVLGSLGYDDLPDGGSYDLIVSNLPGKVGKGPLAELVRGAIARAAPDGMVGLVVVTALADEVAAVLHDTPWDELLRRGNRSHTVFIGRPGPRSAPEGTSEGSPAGGAAFERGRYDRSTITFSAGRRSWTATSVLGLDEFDSLGYATRLLPLVLRALPAQRAVVVNPGQGHRSYLVSVGGHALRALVGRDLLALRASCRLLAGNGRDVPPTVHAVAIPDEVLDDARLVVLDIEDKAHLPWLRSEIERHLDRSGRRSLVLTGRASALGRLEAELLRRRSGSVVAEKSERGHRALAYHHG